jgi:hypothetical protein
MNISQVKIVAIGAGTKAEGAIFQKNKGKDFPLYKEIQDAVSNANVKAVLSKFDFWEYGWFSFDEDSQDYKDFLTTGLNTPCVLFIDILYNKALWKLEGSDQVNYYNFQKILTDMLNTEYTTADGASGNGKEILYKVPNGQVWKGVSSKFLNNIQQALGFDSFCSDFPRLCESIDNVDDFFKSMLGKAKGVAWLAAAGASAYQAKKSYDKKNYYITAGATALTLFLGLGAYRKLK